MHRPPVRITFDGDVDVAARRVLAKEWHQYRVVPSLFPNRLAIKEAKSNGCQAVPGFTGLCLFVCLFVFFGKSMDFPKRFHLVWMARRQVAGGVF